MALEATMKYGLKRIAEALRAYAADQGWEPGDYRVYVHLRPDLPRFLVILVARVFRAPEPWFDVLEFLHKKLRDEPVLARSISLSVRTFEQVAEGGIYTITPSFVEINELLAGELVAEASSSPFSFGQQDS